jgi:hypothetical protein
MRQLTIATAILMIVTAPAWAEHRTFAEPDGTPAAAAGAASPELATAGARMPTDLELELKLGLSGFRLGGRLIGPEGAAGAWLNGGVGPHGFALDGRVQRDDGRAWGFRLDGEVVDEATRLALRWLRDRVLTIQGGVQRL